MLVLIRSEFVALRLLMVLLIQAIGATPKP